MKLFRTALAGGASACALLIATSALAQQQPINVGSAANDGTGDSLRAAFGKVNSNFATTMQKGNNLSDVASTGAARTNLGLGSAALQPSTAFDPAGAAAAVQAGLGSAAAQPSTAFDPSGAASTAQAAGLQKASNLGDLTSAATARVNLGLGSAATLPSTAFDPAGAAASAVAGISLTSTLQKSSNLSDLASPSTARTNLGLGSAATAASSAFDAAGSAAAVQAGLGSAASQPASAFDAAGASTTAQGASLQKSSNLGDLTSAATARTNLALGSASTQASSAFDASGAAAGVQTTIQTALGNRSLTDGPSATLAPTATLQLPSPATRAGLVALMAKASATNPLRILLPSGNLDVCLASDPAKGPIVPVSYIELVGAGQGFVPAGDGQPMDTFYTLNGTNFVCSDGVSANYAFEYLPTAYTGTGGLRNVNSPVNFSLKNASFTGIGAVHEGSQGNSGLTFGRLEDLYISGAPQRGVDLDNPIHQDLYRIYNRAPGVGGIRIRANGSGQPGNLEINHTLTISNSNLTHGLELDAINGGDLNEIKGLSNQVNQYINRSTISQTATLTSGSSTIGVTDSTKFILGEQVSFTSSLGGIIGAPLGTCASSTACSWDYVVQSIVSATGITVGQSNNGTVITPTASGSTTITSMGTPDIEIVGDSTSTISNVDLPGSDVEGRVQCAIYVENASNISVSIMDTPGGSNALVCTRKATGSRFFNGQYGAVANHDISQDSINSYIFGSWSLDLGSGSFGPRGLWSNPANSISYMSMSGTHGGDLTATYQGSGYQIIPNIPIGKKLTYGYCGGNYSIAAIGGETIYNCGGPIAAALPTITAAMVGTCSDLVNIGAGTITFPTSNGQLINQTASKVSTSVSTGQVERICAANTGSGSTTYFWVVDLSNAPN